MPIRVIAIEDHPLMLKAVVDELDAAPDIKVVGTADHGSKLMALVREKSPDVVVLDLGMSTGAFDPISTVRNVLQTFPEVHILILTGYDSRLYIQQLIAAGALGYILKSDDLSLSLPLAVRAVAKGERFYSPAVLQKLLSSPKNDLLNDQELAVVRLVAQGLANNGIAETMGISQSRVRNILTTIYAKFDIRESKEVSPRVAVVNRAKELGLLPLD